jgi:excisionase family DNA binding protein
MDVKDLEVYSVTEARTYLKISHSTVMRMIKSGLIHAAKVGKQYRILGKELLRVVSPKLEDEVGKLYNKGRRWVHKENVNEVTQKNVHSEYRGKRGNKG